MYRSLILFYKCNTILTIRLLYKLTMDKLIITNGEVNSDV